MKIVSVLGALAALAIVVEGQEQLSQYVQMKRVADLVGTWRLDGKVLQPPELAGATFNGKVIATWALDKSAIEFKAKAVSTGPGANGSKMEALGLLTYNENGPYAKRQFNSFFAMGNDGRMLSLQGNFNGKNLVLNGKSPNEEHFDIRVKVGTGDTRKIDVYVVDGKKETALLQLTLTRQKYR